MKWIMIPLSLLFLILEIDNVSTEDPAKSTSNPYEDDGKSDMWDAIGRGEGLERAGEHWMEEAGMVTGWTNI